MIGFGHIAEPDFYTHFPAMLPRSSRPRAAWGTGVYPSKQYFDIKMRCLRQRRHRRRWYLKGADNTPYEKIGDEVRSLADEVPFDIPDSWEWVRLGNIGETNIGLTYKPSDVTSDGVPVLRSNNIQNGQIDYSELLYVSCAVPERAYAHKGDILICARNGSRALVGKSAIVDADGMAFGAFMAIYRSSCNPYIQLFINSYLFRGQLEGATTTTINQVTQEMLKRQLCPLPPIQEQLRIVQKYTELQPLIAAYSNAYDKAQILITAFPEALKKSILQEAVQGKLVPQDPSDEPAEALLKRIRAEKQRLIKEGKIKKDKHESVIFRRDNSHYEKLDGVESCIDDEIPFEIPDTWAWSRLGSLVEVITSGSRDWAKHYSEKGSLFLRMGNLSRNSFELRLNSLKRVQLPEKAEGTRTALQAGDLLFSITGEVGMLGLIPDDFETAYINQHTAMIRFLPLIRNKYLPYFLLTDYAQKCYKSNQHGIKNSFRLDSISNILVPIPPLSEQEQIIRRIEQATNRIATM